MRLWTRLKHVALAALWLCSLSGCGIVDSFSGRSSDINRAAEQSVEEMLVLNIVRASQGVPMEFTNVQTLQATTQISGQGTLSLPFGLTHHPGNDFKQLQLQAGPDQATNQATINVLDTQEFYNALMSPVQIGFIDLYLKGRYPPEQIMMLLVHQIGIQRAQQTTDGSEAEADPTDPELDFVNYPSNDFDFDLFQAFLEYLFDDRRLTTEKTHKTIGPPFPANKDGLALKDVESVPAANLTLEKLSDEDWAKTARDECVAYQGAANPNAIKNPTQDNQSDVKNSNAKGTAQFEAKGTVQFEAKGTAQFAAKGTAQFDTQSNQQSNPQPGCYQLQQEDFTFCFRATDDESSNNVTFAFQCGSHATSGIPVNEKLFEDLIGRLANTIDSDCNEIWKSLDTNERNTLFSSDNKKTDRQNIFLRYCQVGDKGPATHGEGGAITFGDAWCAGQAKALLSLVRNHLTKGLNAKDFLGFTKDEVDHWITALDAATTDGAVAKLENRCFMYVVGLVKKLTPLAIKTDKCKNPDHDDRCFLIPTFVLKFLPRSVESFLYYLGEVTRRQLKPRPGWPQNTIKTLKTLVEPDTVGYGKIDCPRERPPGNAPLQSPCTYIFDLRKPDGTSNPFLSVEYGGKQYMIADDSYGTLAVLELAKQLFALNLSAKTLPSTIIVPLTSPP